MKQLAFVGLIALTVALAPVSHAQYTADFQTNIISGVTSNWSGGYFVGRTNSADVLLIQDSGVLSSGYGFVGDYSSSVSSNNSVVVTGGGSRWQSSEPLSVRGLGNSLVMTNGGKILSLYYYVNGSNNTLVITDTGSSWDAGHSMSSGISGLSNSLVIANGGRMDSADFFAGGGCYSPSRGCTVRVTGPGSVLNTFGSLYVGVPGGYGSITPCASGHSLVITNGGGVISQARGYAGYGSSNTVLITGSGSVWSNYYNFYVGSAGSNNTLVICDGGRLVNPGSGIGGYGNYIGGDPDYSFDSANGNRVLVTGTGSIWTNRTRSISIGYAGAGNSLLISNNAQVFSTGGHVGFGSSSSNNYVLLVDGGIWRTRSGLLTVGVQGSSNSAIVAGGSVIGTGLLIGEASVLCNNLVELDSGSVIVTNSTTNAVLEVRRGKFILNGGTLRVDQFVMTEPCAQFIRTGGTLIYGSAVLTTNLDADGDGMANGWEQDYGLDPLNAADAGADNDGDGFTNLQEFQAGTNPTNASSAFRVLSLESTNNDILVTWQAGGGRTNVVESAPDLAGSYSNVSPNIILPGSGDVTTNYVDTGGATNGHKFYKIRLVP